MKYLSLNQVTRYNTQSPFGCHFLFGSHHWIRLRGITLRARLVFIAYLLVRSLNSQLCLDSRHKTSKYAMITKHKINYYSPSASGLAHFPFYVTSSDSQTWGFGLLAKCKEKCCLHRTGMRESLSQNTKNLKFWLCSGIVFLYPMSYLGLMIFPVLGTGPLWVFTERN